MKFPDNCDVKKRTAANYLTDNGKLSHHHHHHSVLSAGLFINIRLRLGHLWCLLCLISCSCWNVMSGEGKVAGRMCL